MKKVLCVLTKVDVNDVEHGSNLELNCKSPKVIATIEIASPSLPSFLKVPKWKKLKRIQVVEISLNASNDGESANISNTHSLQFCKDNFVHSYF
jgi:hypothetical protein